MIDVPLREYVDGCPKCCHCGALTNRVYAEHALLQCWSCGKFMAPLSQRDAQVILGTVNSCRNILGWDSEASKKIVEKLLAAFSEIDRQ